MSDIDALLFANEIFYSAFANKDMAALEELWAAHVPVACIHPGWNALTDRQEIIESFRGILNGPSPPAIQHVAPQPLLFGKVGIVVCYESIEQEVLVATNVFVQDGAKWLLVHHQAGPAQSLPPVADDQSEGTIN